MLTVLLRTSLINQNNFYREPFKSTQIIRMLDFIALKQENVLM